jgi:hypothetical protein
MELHSRLVHAEAGRRVVRVRARAGGHDLGSALGEGATAEEAEDRATERLRQRLGAGPAEPGMVSPEAPARAPAAAPVRSATSAQPALPPLTPPAPAPAPATAGPTTPAEATPHPQEPPPDPEDWSGELAALDRELQRLGWSREQEALYLERAFGHPSRSRLTTYADLLAYLRALEAMAPGNDPKQVAVPLRRRDLLAQSDQLLAQLGWQAEQGRRLLEQRLGASSRSQLDDGQLLQFNLLLEEALLGGGRDACEPGTLPDPPTLR